MTFQKIKQSSLRKPVLSWLNFNPLQALIHFSIVLMKIYMLHVLLPLKGE